MVLLQVDSIQITNDMMSDMPEWIGYIIAIITALGGQQLIQLWVKSRQDSKKTDREYRKEFRVEQNDRIRSLETSLDKQRLEFENQLLDQRKAFEEQLKTQRQEFEDQMKEQRDVEINLRDEVRKLAEEVAGLRVKNEMLLDYLNQKITEQNDEDDDAI